MTILSFAAGCPFVISFVPICYLIMPVNLDVRGPVNLESGMRLILELSELVSLDLGVPVSLDFEPSASWDLGGACKS